MTPETEQVGNRIVTVFRSELRDDAEGYAETLARTVELAESMSGFVERKSFTADDGERVSIIVFDSAEAQQAWREHPEHRVAQALGRESFYARYRIQVCELLREHEFTQPVVDASSEETPSTTALDDGVCEQCGFAYSSCTPAGCPSLLTAIGERFRALLTQGNDDTLRGRPQPKVWSALEYACHVRDVLLIQRDRLYLALVEDRPSMARMYRDERAVLARYNLQDPDVVAGQVAVAAQLAAEAFSDLGHAAWERLLLYNWPTTQERTVGWLAAHTVHEGQHHLLDFEAVARSQVPGTTG